MIRLILYLILLSALFPQNIVLPKINQSDQIVYHENYILNYSEEHEQAKWVAYSLSADQINGTINRTNDFRPDPLVKTGSATLADYKKSGYDRGHLAAAGDMKRSFAAMSESFYLSNISPQSPSFNRGIWRKLENHVRTWALDNQKLQITTGGILNSSLKKIGVSRVSVPEFFYKVILDYNKPDFKAIGFIIPVKNYSKSLKSYAFTIDEVENRTGIDFFASLPDDLENKIESELSTDKFSFSFINNNAKRHSVNDKTIPPYKKINVNSASKSELMSIPGIGDKLSDKIIIYRNRYGKYQSINDLFSIKGIGKSTANKIKPYIAF